jgi:hypothetical protein
MILEEERNYYQLLRFQSAVRTAIYKERRVAFEHDRFYDLVRTGQAAAFTIHGKSFVTTNTSCSFASVIHYTGKRIIYTKSKLLI